METQSSGRNKVTVLSYREHQGGSPRELKLEMDSGEGGGRWTGQNPIGGHTWSWPCKGQSVDSQVGRGWGAGRLVGIGCFGADEKRLRRCPECPEAEDLMLKAGISKKSPSGRPSCDRILSRYNL